METAQRTTGAALAAIRAALDSVADDRGVATDGERLTFVHEALDLAGRLHTLAVTLVAEADRADAPMTVHGTQTTSWLADTARLTRGEAARLLHEGRRLGELPTLRQACLVGAVSPQQARAITNVLTRLPDDLPDHQVTLAQRHLIGYAAEFDSTGLARLSEHLLEVVAPEVAEAHEAAQLERELAAARRNRHLSFRHDHHGSVAIAGSLPVADAALLIAQVDAIAHHAHNRALDALDPLAETVSPAMRRADALVLLAQQAALHRDAPSHGGDRPRVILTLDYHRLHADAVRAGLLSTGEPIAASDLRRLCCDADVLPVILGGTSEVLDVGREQRLATPALRTALAARDRGCVFPGCDKPPAACHAHHIVPWYLGGATSLDNLVLVCAHHHRIIEPTSDPPCHRWTIAIGDHGFAEVQPPTRVDRHRTPRCHQRFRAPVA